MVHNTKKLKKKKKKERNEVNKAKYQYCFKALGISYIIFCMFELVNLR